MRNTARAATTAAPAKREAILRAALERFAHYGFRRTSMEDIAQEAGISRAAVYLHFRNKEEVFRALARDLHESAVAEVERAAATSSTLSDRLTATLWAKLGAAFEIVHRNAHARELLDENSRLCGDISAEFRERHLKLVRSVIDAAAKRGEIDLEHAGLSAAAAAALLLDSAKGVESGAGRDANPAAYRRRLAQLVRVVVLGLGGRP